MGRLDAEELVLVVFDRTDHDVDAVVLHVHPSEIARLVVVVEQRLRAQLEVISKARIVGEHCGFAQLPCGTLHLFGERFVKRHREELISAVAADDRVRALERRGRRRRGVELFFRHVGRVVTRPFGLGADAGRNGAFAFNRSHGP